MSGDEGFLRRWSRLKSTPTAGTEPQAANVAPLETTAAESPQPAQADAAPPPLPPVESLTSESDFAPFMRGGTDPQLRAEALKKLFDDPRFNVMDRLDVYIDDYSKPDPMPEGWLEKMNQVARLGVFQPQETATDDQGGSSRALNGDSVPPRLPAAETDRAPQASNQPAPQAASPENGVEQGS